MRGHDTIISPSLSGILVSCPCPVVLSVLSESSPGRCGFRDPEASCIYDSPLLSNPRCRISQYTVLHPSGADRVVYVFAQYGHESSGVRACFFLCIIEFFSSVPLIVQYSSYENLYKIQVIFFLRHQIAVRSEGMFQTNHANHGTSRGTAFAFCNRGKSQR